MAMTLIQSSQYHRFDNAIDVLLCELREYRSCGPCLTDESFQVSNALRAEAFCGRQDLGPLVFCFTRNHWLPTCSGK